MTSQPDPWWFPLPTEPDQYSAAFRERFSAKSKEVYETATSGRGKVYLSAGDHAEQQTRWHGRKARTL